MSFGRKLMKSSLITWITKNGTLEWWVPLFLCRVASWLKTSDSKKPDLNFLLWLTIQWQTNSSDWNVVNYTTFTCKHQEEPICPIFLATSDSYCCILQPASISENGGTHKPMLVIVQNPGMSDFASSDDLVKKPNKLEDTFHMRPNFQRVACHTQPSVTSSKGPGLFSSMIDYERLQLRQRSCGDLSSSIESGSRRDNQFPSSCEQSVKEGSRFPDGKDVKNPTVFVSDVVVDLKGLKGYSLLQCESPCGDYRTLHSRSTSILTSQELAPLQSSIVWSNFHYTLVLFLQPATFSKLGCSWRNCESWTYYRSFRWACHLLND